MFGRLIDRVSLIRAELKTYQNCECVLTTLRHLRGTQLPWFFRGGQYSEKRPEYSVVQVFRLPWQHRLAKDRRGERLRLQLLFAVHKKYCVCETNVTFWLRNHALWRQRRTVSPLHRHQNPQTSERRAPGETRLTAVWHSFARPVWFVRSRLGGRVSLQILDDATVAVSSESV